MQVLPDMGRLTRFQKAQVVVHESSLLTKSWTAMGSQDADIKTKTGRIMLSVSLLTEFMLPNIC